MPNVRQFLLRQRRLKEKSPLSREFVSKMGPGESPYKFTTKVDRVARNLDQLGKIGGEDGKNLAILS